MAFRLSNEQDIRLNASHNYAKGVDFPALPMDFRYLLIGNYFNGKLRPELNLRHVLKQNRIANSFGETKTPAFSVVDVSMNYSITNQLEITVAANNLFDETYYEHLTRSVKGSSQAIYAPGQNFVFTIVAKL